MDSNSTEAMEQVITQDRPNPTTQNLPPQAPTGNLPATIPSSNQVQAPTAPVSAEPQTAPAPYGEISGIDAMSLDPFAESMMARGQMSRQPRNGTQAARDEFERNTQGVRAPAPQAPNYGPAAPITDPAAVQQPQSQPTEQQPQGANELSPEVLAKLKIQQLEQQIAELSKAQQQPQQQQQPQPQSQAPQANDPRSIMLQKVANNFRVPDQLLHMLESSNPEDVRTAVLNVMQVTAMNAAAHVYDEMQLQMDALMQQMEQKIAKSIQAFNVFLDFYSHYPGLNNPSLYPVVTQVANQVRAAKGVGNDAYSPQLRDEIAQRVASTLNLNLEAFRAKPPMQARAGIAQSEPGSNSPMPHMFSGAGSRPGRTADPQAAMEAALGFAPGTFNPPQATG